ncbi:hypothetical protein BGZ50_000050 [Haplosporangium sp. Z 11]|nr:hypothetical protein BGZ50_000050 [Haplosporangium sp. Z 11]
MTFQEREEPPHSPVPLPQFSAKNRELKEHRRKFNAPPKLHPTRRHLNELASQRNLLSSNDPVTKQDKIQSPDSLDSAAAEPRQDNKPLSIKPLKMANFLADGVHRYVSDLRHPNLIPGTNLFDKIYAMGVLPVLIVAMAIIQSGIGLLVDIVTYTRIGAHYYGIFFNDQIALFDESGKYFSRGMVYYVDPDGTDEAIRQLVDREPKHSPSFSYHIGNLLLIMSSMAYQRNEKLVAEASKILVHIKNKDQQAKAAALLEESERVIDETATKNFGMRFTGISELKTFGGPFAGMFYNDDAIVLVFKGTSVLAFNEYLTDVTIQRVDASEYLYGEVHKGFYECLFPDLKPTDWYETVTHDNTNPFNTIMDAVLNTAKAAKQKTGKPVNLWLAGHSLGGALAALMMARLQMPMRPQDPLMTGTDTIESNKSATSKTVLDELLARYSEDPELLVLRDCYSVASPKVGDTTFAKMFARNHLRFCDQSPYKTTYWRMVADMDVVTYMPPGCSADPTKPFHRHFSCQYCQPSKDSPECHHNSNGANQQQHYPECSISPKLCSPLSRGHDKRQNSSETALLKPPKHRHSLLDYQHIGQLIKLHNVPKVPTVKPSAFEADLSQGIVRSEEEIQVLMTKLSKLAALWKALDQDRDSNTTTVSGRISEKRTQPQIADDIAKAQALYSVDELKRLRQPGFFEQIILSFPTLLSHAPAAYQRNLVQARFYFKSFPGVEFEERVDRWLDDAQKQAQVHTQREETKQTTQGGQLTSHTDGGAARDVDAASRTRKVVSRKVVKDSQSEATITHRIQRFAEVEEVLVAVIVEGDVEHVEDNEGVIRMGVTFLRRGAICTRERTGAEVRNADRSLAVLLFVFDKGSDDDDDEKSSVLKDVEGGQKVASEEVAVEVDEAEDTDRALFTVEWERVMALQRLVDRVGAKKAGLVDREKVLAVIELDRTGMKDLTSDEGDGAEQGEAVHVLAAAVYFVECMDDNEVDVIKGEEDFSGASEKVKVPEGEGGKDAVESRLESGF